MAGISPAVIYVFVMAGLVPAISIRGYVPP
jgi:hypothetical protein